MVHDVTALCSGATLSSALYLRAYLYQFGCIIFSGSNEFEHPSTHTVYRFCVYAAPKSQSSMRTKVPRITILQCPLRPLQTWRSFFILNPLPSCETSIIAGPSYIPGRRSLRKSKMCLLICSNSSKKPSCPSGLGIVTSRASGTWSAISRCSEGVKSPSVWMEMTSARGGRVARTALTPSASFSDVEGLGRRPREISWVSILRERCI